eukprot:gene14606-17271_t
MSLSTTYNAVLALAPQYIFITALILGFHAISKLSRRIFQYVMFMLAVYFMWQVKGTMNLLAVVSVFLHVVSHTVSMKDGHSYATDIWVDLIVHIFTAILSAIAAYINRDTPSVLTYSLVMIGWNIVALIPALQPNFKEQYYLRYLGSVFSIVNFTVLNVFLEPHLFCTRFFLEMSFTVPIFFALTHNVIDIDAWAECRYSETYWVSCLITSHLLGLI